ncbi:MAG: peptidoglycan-binding protein [Pseudobutyrivibrio sp.]|nr:peptidoglycan-binding protein [Pseudobutyrivibrio sp.]
MAITGLGLAQYAESKKGTPYFYGSKMKILTEPFMKSMHAQYPKIVTAAYMALARAKKQVGKVNVDCSGLISAFTGHQLGSAQLHSQAYARLPIATWKSWAPGVVTWREGHVGVYLGNGKVAEAKGINYGVVITDITKGKWTCGLTFSWITYDITTPVSSKVVTYKQPNPYAEPNRTVYKGMVGQDVKWVQYELVEAGYKLAIDGDFGSKTDKALRKFQESAKLEVDGRCGRLTRGALKEN